MNKKDLKLHFRRFEFKYFIEKDIAEIIIPELLKYSNWDPYAQEKGYYNCYSLYFDSENLKSYHDKVDGLISRKKVRIRSYDKNFLNAKSLFLELKRKSGDVIIKDREVISGKDVDMFLSDNFSLVGNSNLDQAFCNEFIFETANYGMSPKIFVSYKRLPFIDKNNDNFRITFDYDIEFARADGFKIDGEPRRWEERFVVMEIKFTGSMPFWFSNIIHKYQLQKTESCKYCFGVDTLFGEPIFQ